MSSVELATIETYAPYVHLFPYGNQGIPRTHPFVTASPNYAPCSVDYFLQHVQLITPGSGGARRVSAARELSCATCESTLEIADDTGARSPLRLGMPQSDVPVYVHVRNVSGQPRQYDIQYWFFYAVRGRSTAYLRAGFDCFCDLLGPHEPIRPNQNAGAHSYIYTEGYQGPGEHLGDWKHITVRVQAHGKLTMTFDLLGVFYAQHDGGFWVEGDKVPLHGDSHPIVYSARNTHSCYPTPGIRFQQRSLTFRLPGVSLAGLGLLEWTADGGDVWDCARSVEVVSDESPAWLRYPGYWGPLTPGGQRLAPDTFTRPNLRLRLPAVVRNFLVGRGQRLLDTLTAGARSPSFQLPWLQGDPGQPGSRRDAILHDSPAVPVLET